MSDESQEAEGETPKADGTEAVPAYMTKADFEAWAESFAKKINAEQARLRKKLAAPTDEAPAPAAAPASVATMADVSAAFEIGKLEASLPAELVESLASELEGMSYPERARAYKIAALAARTGATPTHRPETGANTGPGRAATSARRESVPRPRTLVEYSALAAKDPKRKALLDADDTFDPSTLPYR